MVKQFFFGSSDSPLFMFHHALGAILILIFFCLFIYAIIGWVSSRRKNKIPSSPKKLVTEKKPSDFRQSVVEEKISVTPTASIPVVASNPETDTAVARDSEDAVIYHTSKNIPEPVAETVTEEIEVYPETICNTREQLLYFTEIMLNKKLTEQDWDKRLPETILLDHRSYHQLIFQLLYLNADTTETTSRFKLVLETSNEVAINHQIYFRNWMAPQTLIASFKSENNSTVTPAEKNIHDAVRIAEKKSWKLQASTSEQGTMINLLMKCAIPK